MLKLWYTYQIEYAAAIITNVLEEYLITNCLEHKWIKMPEYKTIRRVWTQFKIYN